MATTLALIHTSPLMISIFDDLRRKEAPEVEAFHMLDESLLKNTLRDQMLTKATIRRLVNYAQSAREAGADVVLVTCSSIGPAVDAARQVVDIPVLRIDEAMAESAVRLGRRIGVAATLSSTLEPTAALLQSTAAAQGREIEVVSGLCEGAFDAVCSGDVESHDRIVLSKLGELMDKADVIVLAQASMARVAEKIPPEEQKAPILSSPALAMARAKEVIGKLEAASA